MIDHSFYILDNDLDQLWIYSYTLLLLLLYYILILLWNILYLNHGTLLKVVALPPTLN
jgi:hypothetical protein